MTYKLILGDDQLCFGVDDVVDYLKQFGHVLISQINESVWLFPCVENDHRNHQQYERLYCCCVPKDGRWEFNYFQRGTATARDKFFHNNLTQAVLYYLEQTKEKHT